jgi:hypothetical protein
MTISGGLWLEQHVHELDHLCIAPLAAAILGILQLDRGLNDDPFTRDCC